MNKTRDQLASRLGFLLLSAGCAIGLGNVWRFPYVVGKYGGLLFLVAYFFFLLAVSLPIMVMEFSAGRASQKTMARCYHELSPTKGWRMFSWFGYVGPFVLMMFYIPIAGWLVSYCYNIAIGTLAPLNPQEVGAYFENMLAQPIPMYVWGLIVTGICYVICALGVQKGIERYAKFMMMGLLFILLVLAGHSLTLSGVKEGLTFYLAPNFEKIQEAGLFNMINDAMNQAFFTLSVGMGGMMIFGSYLNKEKSLTGEALYIGALDTFVAFMAGIIIFPACFTFGVEPGAGPSLIFITLPNVFNEMNGGLFWGTLFFVFMSFAALTTVIGVMESIIAYSIDALHWSRKKSININFGAMFFLILPCILGFSVWSGIKPFGEGSVILDLLDFIVSNNILPLGGLILLLFCTHKSGWGFENFCKEADTGSGAKFPKWLYFYLAYILPFIIGIIILQGYSRFF